MRDQVLAGVLRLSVSVEKEPQDLHVLQELHGRAVPSRSSEEDDLHRRAEDSRRRRRLNPEGLRLPRGLGFDQLLASREPQTAQVGRQGDQARFGRLQ